MSLGQSLITARGAPPPLALARRPSFAGLPSSGPPQRGCRGGDPGTSLGPQALSLLAGPNVVCGAGAPPPTLLFGASAPRNRLKAAARSRSAVRLRRATFQRATPTRLPRWGPRHLARAAGAITAHGVAVTGA